MNEEQESKYLDGQFCCPKCACVDFLITDSAKNRESKELDNNEPVQCERCGRVWQVDELHLWQTKGVH